MVTKPDDYFRDIYASGTPDAAKDAPGWATEEKEKTMQHASGIWGRDVMLRMVRETVHGDETIVDLGAGAGYPTLKLSQMVPRGRVTGIELSQAMLGLTPGSTPVTEVYEGAENLQFVNGDVTQLPVRTGSADLVTSFMVLHNLPIDAIEKVFRECARILSLEIAHQSLA